MRSSSAGIEQAFALVAGLIAAGGLSGSCGGYLVLVELHQVVGGGDRRHSERTADLPRRWKLSMRRLCLVCANTGSTIALRLR